MSETNSVRIAPNNPVFDLPVLVGIEEGLFADAGLEVGFVATYDDREKDTIEQDYLKRLKEGLFEAGAVDSYNVCEWATIDRVERGKGGLSGGTGITSNPVGSINLRGSFNA